MSTARPTSSQPKTAQSARTHAVRVLRHVWIPLKDGTRLAARVWLPADARGPVPAVLEYIPYRKNDGTAPRDVTLHGQFAQAGYASVRVDCRGSGDSDGVMLDEYHQTELDDALEVLAWIEQQDWADGQVAIIGKSWGGFNGLQIAALQPPQLSCIVTVCSTDDRYADDVHYAGGSLLASEMLPWAATMLAYNARPGDPAVLGDSWRQEWLDRLDKTVPYAEEWISHQRRDAYWEHGSVCEDYSAIQVPVYAVGGWLDPYRGAIFRLMENLDQAKAPTKALIGPWAHTYPHQAEPGPAMDFQGECVRWFDHWMHGADNGIMDEPRLRAWMPQSAPFGSDRETREGRWIAEPSWPAPGVEARRIPLTGMGGHEGSALLRSPLAIGAPSGDFLKFGDIPGQYGDQAADDGRSHTFTGPVLAETVEILGAPEVTLRVTSDRPQAQLAVRLCEVFPDGSSKLATTGLLNLTHRDGHAEPQPLEPGRAYDVTVPLFAIGHAFGAGNRIRVSVSASLWPWAWPSPERVTVELDAAHGELTLPVRPPRPAEDEALRPFAPPRGGPPHSIEMSGIPGDRTVTYDLETGEQTIATTPADGTMVDHADGLTRTGSDLNRFRLTEGDPLSAVVECERDEAISRADWVTRVHTRSRMTADESDFLVVNTLTAYEGQGAAERQVFARTWTFSVPRDQV
ncbi:CocE/NonD family hydrolase [Streptomyces iconiensis]|uniref:CocE/NonD family hydrolase n=1 Tax=Streptomyces iconiensis TaxID=1384038 RepID=A0ABT7A912_9ACTN|nr:CocE/NonD family hydrolase [Streptomyces iconiensis]MDJ1137532.1 CocE/NonD family hydrolase [Streptomyces iconiensis]